MNVPVCGRCHGALEDADLRCPVCGRSTAALARRESVQVQVLRCTSCAASIAYDPDHEAPVCVYCGSVYELEIREDPIEQIDVYLPFLVQPQESREALKAWMGTLGWFRPSDLRSSSRLEELKPVWWVGWIFNATALVSWTADSNEGADDSKWAPHSGQEGFRFENLVISASQGLTYAEAMAVASTCDLSTRRPEPDGPPAAVTEVFSVRRSAGRERVHVAIDAESRQRVTDTCVPGTRNRHVHTQVLLRNLETQRVAFPAYVMAYNYRGTLYRAVVSGQSRHSVQATAPYSLAKIVLAIAGGTALMAAVVALIAMR